MIETAKTADRRWSEDIGVGRRVRLPTLLLLVQRKHTDTKKGLPQTIRIVEDFGAVRTRLELVTPCVTGMYSNLLN